MNAITSQSPDIAQGVDAKAAEGKETAEQGAGDQGLMFGYACNETPELMPAPIMFAHQLGRELTTRPQERAKWRGCDPTRRARSPSNTRTTSRCAITNVVISTQHARDVKHKTIKEFCIEKIIKKVLPERICSPRKPSFSSTRPAASSSAGRRATPA